MLTYCDKNDNIVYESGAQNAAYTYGVGLISMTQGQDECYYNKNGHGDVVQMTDATGAVTDSYTYDAFGNQLSSTNAYNPFRYCGEYFDTETDFIYLRNRYYNPQIGRFITEDPAKDGTNWYVYCGNNPVMFVDPSGLISVVFYGDGMGDQAKVREKYYNEKYGTVTYTIGVNSAEKFIDSWNKFFDSDYPQTIDAIEIISHGSIEGKVGKDKNGTAYSTGYIYFTDKKANKLYAREVSNMAQGDRTVGDLYYVAAKELNINSCNGANPDTYNVVYAFMQRTNISGTTTGFDGGAEWNPNANGIGIGDHVSGGGWYVPDDKLPWHAFGDNWYLARRHQSTFWKYAEKSNGIPIRERQGRRYFK